MPATDTAERVNQTTAHHDAELVPVSPPQTRALTPPQSWQKELGGKPNLAAALCKAILECPKAPLDAENKYHGYWYTSSAAIFALARQALASNGIAPFLGPITVDGYERTGVDRFELKRSIILVHAGSGESITTPIAWPICPEKGRPLDKATGAAATLSLRYFYRDLLLISCKDPEPDVEARDDTARQQQPAAPKKEKAAKPPPPANGVELRDRVEARDAFLAEKGRIKAGELIQYVSAALVRGDHSAALALAAGPALECALVAAREFEKKLAAKVAS